MGVMRVHEIAKEAGISNQNILIALRNLGFEVKSHMSVVDDQMYGALEKEIERLKSDPRTEDATEKEIPKEPQVKKKSYVAAFISAKKGLKIWIKGPEVNIIPGVGRHIVQGSGDFVEFKQGRYQTSDKKKIKFLLEHKGFSGNSGNWFFPDPTDPTGFWLDRGYYKVEMVKTRTPVNPNAVIEEGKKQAVAVATTFAGKAASEHTTQTQPLRTSDGGGG